MHNFKVLMKLKNPQWEMFFASILFPSLCTSCMSGHDPRFGNSCASSLLLMSRGWHGMLVHLCLLKPTACHTVPRLARHPGSPWNTQEEAWHACKNGI